MGNITEGLQVTVIGISTVFTVLIILMVVLMIMEKIFRVKPKKAVIKKEEIQPVVKEEEMNDSELIAVLTAAIAASLNTSTYNLNIKSFKRVNNNTPIWNRVSRSEQVNNRL